MTLVGDRVTIQFRTGARPSATHGKQTFHFVGMLLAPKHVRRGRGSGRVLWRPLSSESGALLGDHLEVRNGQACPWGLRTWSQECWSSRTTPRSRASSRRLCKAGFDAVAPDGATAPREGIKWSPVLIPKVPLPGMAGL